MPLSGFDIRTLTDFLPPASRCARCLALVHCTDMWDWDQGKGNCPVCRVEYQTLDYDNLTDFLRAHGLHSGFKDLLGHARKLAGAARETRWMPPLRALNTSLLRAEKFVHFVSWGIDWQMLGALRLLSERVPVYGVVSNVTPETRAELTEYMNEAPNMKVRAYPAKSGWDAPHQKLLVIDGLIAFVGSANLTVNGWRKSADGRDLIELVTDVDKVRDLNNRYFSPVWAHLSREQGPVMMMRPVPI